MGKYEPYSVGRRDLSCKNHWEALDDSYKITKPTVICFGGNATVTPLDANAMCKIAQGLMGIREAQSKDETATMEDVDFIGVSYGRDKRKGTIEIGSLTAEERLELAYKLFVPLFINGENEFYSTEQILKNFNQVTFFNHCHGASEVSELVEMTKNEMISFGLDPKIANEAINQMFAVSYAPMVESSCPSLQVVPMKDDVIMYGPLDSPITTNFLEEKMGNVKKSKKNGTIAYKDDKQTVTVVVSAMSDKYASERGVGIVSRDSSWRYMEKSAVYGDEVSQVMGYALARSVSNSIQNQTSDNLIPKTDTDEILHETKSILAKTQNSRFESIIEDITKGYDDALLENELTFPLSQGNFQEGYTAPQKGEEYETLQIHQDYESAQQQLLAGTIKSEKLEENLTDESAISPTQN